MCRLVFRVLQICENEENRRGTSTVSLPGKGSSELKKNLKKWRLFEIQNRFLGIFST